MAADFRGGVENRYFPGARVRFFSDEGAGTSARVLSCKNDPKVGIKKVALESPLAVPSGALGMWDLPPFRHDKEKDLLWTRAADDLGGVTAALTFFDALPMVDPKGRTDV